MFIEAIVEQQNLKSVNIKAKLFFYPTWFGQIQVLVFLLLKQYKHIIFVYDKALSSLAEVS